jgi:hypothetical protein
MTDSLTPSLYGTLPVSQGPSVGDVETVSAKARYHFVLGGLPVVGAVPLYVACRGTVRDNCFASILTSTAVIDHTVMVGTSCSFSQSA